MSEKTPLQLFNEAYKKQAEQDNENKASNEELKGLDALELLKKGYAK